MPLNQFRILFMYWQTYITMPMNDENVHEMVDTEANHNITQQALCNN